MTGNRSTQRQSDRSKGRQLMRSPTVKEKITALENAENNYNIWMDMFPNQLDPFYLGLQKQYDNFSDFVGLNPKNEE